MATRVWALTALASLLTGAIVLLPSQQAYANLRNRRNCAGELGV
jgi:hypothetical protein